MKNLLYPFLLFFFVALIYSCGQGDHNHSHSGHSHDHDHEKVHQEEFQVTDTLKVNSDTIN